MRPEDVTPIDLLDAAIDRLQRTGWVRGSYGEMEGPNCAVGALQFGFFDLTNRMVRSIDMAYGTVYHRLNKQVANRSALSAWNDASGRTAEDVILAFKELRYELEAEL